MFKVASVTGDTTFTISQTNDDPVDNDDVRTNGYWACTTHPTVDICMSDVVADVYAATVSYDTATVGTALSHARIMPFTTAKDALEELAAMHSGQFDWGFYDDFTFRCKAVANPATTTNWWQWDEESAGYSWQVHSNAEYQVDHVTVLYGDDGTHTFRGCPRRLSVPASPAYSDRVALIDMSDKVLTDVQADTMTRLRRGVSGRTGVSEEVGQLLVVENFCLLACHVTLDVASLNQRQLVVNNRMRCIAQQSHTQTESIMKKGEICREGRIESQSGYRQS